MCSEQQLTEMQPSKTAGEFYRYARKGFADMRDLHEGETLQNLLDANVSVSQADKDAWGTVPSGKIARNPVNPNDQWYVADAFFQKHYNNVPVCRV